MENLIEQAAKSGRCWMGGRRVVQPKGFKTVDSLRTNGLPEVKFDQIFLPSEFIYYL